MNAILCKFVLFLLLLTSLLALLSTVESATRDTAKQNNAPLGTKFGRLQKQAAKTPIISFTSETFTKYYAPAHSTDTEDNQPRNYSSFILFTVNDPKKCPNCQAVNQEFQKLVEAFVGTLENYSLDDPKFLSNPVFFGKCDLQKCREIIKKAGWKSLPQFVFIPLHDSSKQQKEGYLGFEIYDSLQKEFSAKALADVVRIKSGYSIEISEPIAPKVALVISGIVIIWWLIIVVIPKIMIAFKQPMFWFAIALGVYCFVMSGAVFNAIHTPPWFYSHPHTGQILLIYPAARQQFVIEGILMASVFAVLALLIAAINDWIPKIQNQWNQRIAFILVASAFYGVYTFTMMIFRKKYSFYPL